MNLKSTLNILLAIVIIFVLFKIAFFLGGLAAIACLVYLIYKNIKIRKLLLIFLIVFGVSNDVYAKDNEDFQIIKTINITHREKVTAMRACIDNQTMFIFRTHEHKILSVIPKNIAIEDSNGNIVVIPESCE